MPTKSHDLNARAFELARQKGITFRDALRALAAHGAAVRRMNVRVAHRQQRRAERARAIADRISP